MCRRACVRSENVSTVQIHVDSSACGGMCVQIERRDVLEDRTPTGGFSINTFGH